MEVIQETGVKGSYDRYEFRCWKTFINQDLVVEFGIKMCGRVNFWDNRFYETIFVQLILIFLIMGMHWIIIMGMDFHESLEIYW